MWYNRNILCIIAVNTSGYTESYWQLFRKNIRSTFGGWLNLLSVIQIVTQVGVLKGKCNYSEIAIQTVFAFVYGYLTDLSVWLIRDITVTSYPMQFLFMLLGCIILALGIWIQLKGGAAMLPGEAMNRAISKVTGKRYENIKIFSQR